MATQTLENKMEGTDYEVVWKICRGFGSIVAAKIKTTTYTIEMILLPWHNFIKGDLEEWDENIMIDVEGQKETISSYLDRTDIDQKKFLGEREGAPIAKSIRRAVMRAITHMWDHNKNP